MKNYSTFANSFHLIKLYLRDSLQGLLRQSFLKNPKSRYAILLASLLAYLVYFYINVVEYSKLSHIGQQYSFEELKTIILVSISSYNNLAIIAGLFIFLFINTTVKLTPSSLFMSKVLPFHEKEVYLSVKWFKLGMALCCFEFFFIILIPGLSLLRSPLAAIFLFFSAHCFFLSSYLLSNWIYILSLKYLPLSAKSNHLLITITYFICALIYSFSLRFQIDSYLAKQLLSPEMLAGASLLVSVVGLVLLFVLDRTQLDLVFLKQSFLKVPPVAFLKGRVKWASLAVIRTKFFLYSLLLVLFIGCYALFSDGTELAAHHLLNFWPFLSIVFVYYADSTMKHRTIYTHLGIETKEEVIILVIAILAFQLPTALLSIYLKMPPVAFLQGVTLSLASLVIGFLFPRSTSSSNEMVSLLLIVLVLILMLLMISIHLSLLPIAGLLLVLLIYVIKKETENR